MPPFAAEAGFDFEHDYDLICASFAFAYGIRLRNPECRMSWREFEALLCNLPGDSQLSQVIWIRKSEGDELKSLNPQQRKLRDDWYSWIADNSRSSRNNEEDLEAIFRSMFYSKGGKA